jgi:hypothetical protein
MTKVLEFDSAADGAILIEVDEEYGGEQQEASAIADFAQKASISLEQALAPIKPIVTKAMSAITDLPTKPDQLEVEFGLKLSGSAGAIIAKAEGEATIKVKVVWKPAQK